MFKENLTSEKIFRINTEVVQIRSVNLPSLSLELFLSIVLGLCLNRYFAQCVVQPHWKPKVFILALPYLARGAAASRRG